MHMIMSKKYNDKIKNNSLGAKGRERESDVNVEEEQKIKRHELRKNYYFYWRARQKKTKRRKTENN
jgi:hypothetical protein